MSSIIWWLANLVAAVGLAVCVIRVRKLSLGLFLFAIYFAYNLILSVVVAVRQYQQDAEYVRHFVRQQIGPNAWTAPVLHSNVNLSAPFTYALLVAGVILLSRRLAIRSPQWRFATEGTENTEEES